MDEVHDYFRYYHPMCGNCKLVAINKQCNPQEDDMTSHMSTFITLQRADSLTHKVRYFIHFNDNCHFITSVDLLALVCDA